MKFYAKFLFMILLMSCSSKFSKENHDSTSMINDSLYIEVYLVYKGGVFSSNSYSYYVTDSLNFRTYLYTITQDSDGLDVELRNNILFVYKITSKDTIEVNKIDITEEKQKGVFE